MENLMGILVVILMAFVLQGCATAQPFFYNGGYYMAGDSSCKRVRALSSNRVMCMDGDGNDTGYRNAMTDQQLQMYRHNQSMQQQQTPSNKTTTCIRNYNNVNCF